MTDIMAGISYSSISIGPTQLFKFNTEKGFLQRWQPNYCADLADVFLV